MAVVNNPKLYTDGFKVKIPEIIIEDEQIIINTDKPITLISDEIITVVEKKEEPVTVIEDLDKTLEEMCCSYVEDKDMPVEEPKENKFIEKKKPGKKGKKW